MARLRNCREVVRGLGPLGYLRGRFFSPIPYKVFTIAAGAMSMALLPFTLASFIGRGLRFFLVAGLMHGAARMESLLHKYVDRLGWATVAIVVVAGIWTTLH